MQTNAEIASFLRDAGWEHAVRSDFSVVGSHRQLARLTRVDGASAILLIAQADQRMDILVHLAPIVRRLSFPAPDIFASDVPRGLVLMEDFGSKNLGAALDAGAERAPYDQVAVQLLARLHDAFDQTMVSAVRIPVHNAAYLTDQATLFLDHYFKRVKGRFATARERSSFVEAWHETLVPLDGLPRSLVVREYTPDAAMILDRPLFNSPMGLTNFQEAGIGPIAVDLAAWCEQTRHDGGLERLNNVVEAYCKVRDYADGSALLVGAQVLAAHRATRFLGQLARLNQRSFVPRTVQMLKTLMAQQKALQPVRRWFDLCAPLL